MALPTIHRQ